MKKLSNKGFTLIELLAVIVILSILVAVAVPAVTRYLSFARESAYVSSASGAIEAVRLDVINKGYSADVYYTLENINELLEKKLVNSPYSRPYASNSYVAVRFDEAGIATYSICLTDGSNGFGSGSSAVLESDISEDSLQTGKADVSCTAPVDISAVK